MNFTRESFLKTLGINEMPELYGKNFDAVMQEYNERGVWFLTDEFLTQIQTDFAMFDEKYEFVKKSLEKVRANELLSRHSLLLYHMLADRATGEIANVTETAVPPSEDERATYEMSAFFAQLAFAPKMAKFFRDREVPEDVLLLTIRDVFDGSLHNYNKLFGRDGFEADRIFRWNQRLIDCTILHIGILNFEMRTKFIESAVVLRNKAGEAAILVHDQPVSRSGIIAGSAGAEDTAFFGAFTETDDAYEGYPVDPWNAIASSEKKTYPKSEWELFITDTDPVISVHIPRSDTPITKEATDDAYAQAADFFIHEVTNKQVVFVCHSWLLFSDTLEVFPKHTNTYRFIHEYDVVWNSYDKEGEYNDAWRLFDMDYTGNIEDYPENTSMRRVYKQYLLDGGRTGKGFGIIIY